MRTTRTLNTSGRKNIAVLAALAALAWPRIAAAAVGHGAVVVAAARALAGTGSAVGRIAARAAGHRRCACPAG